MPSPNHAHLVQWQRDLETALTQFADDTLAPAFAPATDPALYATARNYLLRPSKRLVGLRFSSPTTAWSTTNPATRPAT